MEYVVLRMIGCYSVVVVVINLILVFFCVVDYMDGMGNVVEVFCCVWFLGFMLFGDVIVMDVFF